MPGGDSNSMISGGNTERSGNGSSDPFKPSRLQSALLDNSSSHRANLLWMVFMFGLIHGFGLSTRLQSFDMGTDSILAKIICFNIGVEFGQIAALIPIILFINFWKDRKGYQTFHLITNWGLVVAGIGLFILQMYGYFYHSH